MYNDNNRFFRMALLRYKSIIQLIDPDFEYHKTLEKIDNIINFTYNKIYSDDGLLSKMKE